MTRGPSATRPPPPKVRLSLAVTGHRAAHPAYAANAGRIAAALTAILDLVDATVAATPLALGPGTLAATRLHTLLTDGADQLAAEMALARGYELVAPLPFGRALYEAINAAPADAADARAMLAGGAAGDEAEARRRALRRLGDQARLLELADQDPAIAALFLAKLDTPADFPKAETFSLESSRRVGLAGCILIEQSDVVIAVWDGATTARAGGTGHTVEAALHAGASVVWIDPAAPEAWRILRAPESLASLRGLPPAAERENDLAAIVRDVLRPAGGAPRRHGRSAPDVRSLDAETWRPRSKRRWHAYRRVEALFGQEGGQSRFRSIIQPYETPDAIAAGSGATVDAEIRALPGVDPDLADRIDAGVLRRFAWADGVSAYLSDSYRGGMIVNFLLSSLAIAGGVAYLPLASTEHKWWFASFELVLLLGILLITFLGQRRRWHGRWFETRRVAEYLRHSPLLLALGVARAPGRWARGAETSWPEWYARHALREIGLPRSIVTPAYLRRALTGLLDHHVVRQRDYHAAKARRLTAVHHNLDRFSETLFQLAVASVAFYLVLKGAAWLDLVGEEPVDHLAKLFTVLGVAFPTFGAAIAGIRYFGDFERFAAISEVTAEKLGAVHARIAMLAAAPDAELSYGRVAELAHAADDIVVSEIENWQAVFGGKQITVPV